LQTELSANRDGQNGELPLVSVLMPTYKQEAFIGRAVQSLIAQSFPKWELVIVDDGSPPGVFDWNALSRAMNDRSMPYGHALADGYWKARIDMQNAAILDVGAPANSDRFGIAAKGWR
jgi:hypothetical protein